MTPFIRQIILKWLPGSASELCFKGLVLILCFSVNPIQAQDLKLMFSMGHTDHLSYALYSPDGKKIITSSNDKTAKIWDVSSGFLLADLKGSGNYLYTEEFSKDGHYLLAASFDSTAKIWDIRSGELIHTLQGHTNSVWGAKYSDDGKKIVTCSKDSTAIVWDASNGKMLKIFTGHQGFIQSAAFSPDGLKLATASYDGTATIWNVTNGKPLYTFRHADAVYAIHFSNDGKHALTASKDSTAKLWDVETGQMIFDLKGHHNQVWVAEYSHDNKTIVTSSFDGELKLWNAESGMLIHELIGHRGSIWHAKFSADDKQLVSASDDRTIKIWDVVSGIKRQDIKAHDNKIRTVYFSPDGKKILSCSDDKTAKIWDVETGELFMNLKGNAGGMWSVNLSTDTKKMVTASSDNIIKIWDISTGRIISQLKGHTDTVNQVMFSSDAKKILSVSADKTVRIWDAENGHALAELKKHSGNVTHAAFNHAGDKCITASNDNSIKIWDTEHAILLQDCIGHTAGFWTILFSADGSKFASASKDGTVKVWEVSSGRLLKTIRVYNDSISKEPTRINIAFSPDNEHIVTTGNLNDAHVWELNINESIFTLSGHTAMLTTAKYSPDGKRIVTASLDKTVRIWDAAKGTLIQTLYGHSFHVKSALFSEDGTRIISTSRDNSAKIWDAITGKLLHTFASTTANAWWSGEVDYAGFCNDGAMFLTASGRNSVSIWNVNNENLIYTILPTGGPDFIILDKEGRFDGSSKARKFLYFTCGTEVISFEQVKSKLWVEDLAKRLMYNDSISSSRLADLDICSSLPQVEIIDQGSNYLRYKITPGKAGLGETILSVNGIITRKFPPSALKKTGREYFLTVKMSDLNMFLIPGNDNDIMLRSMVATNDISSRGIIVKKKSVNKALAAPDLYAIMIGVSNYKGNELDLQFADKDANDLSLLIKKSAEKLFDSQHVFVYNLTTADKHYRYPEKAAIKKTFEDISRKSKPNDILFIFFAGHGVVKTQVPNKNKQDFYFLTAEASKDAIKGNMKDIGIGTEELIGWLNPSVMKAQKRVLVFDACNSGQAIKDMVGKQNAFSIRGEHAAEIDKLNEQSGLFILAASASMQSAYEMPVLGHGLLTYALLEAVKRNPSILDQGKFLNVGHWFEESKNAAFELSKKNGTRQEPQLSSLNNFNIGIVDTDVTALIDFPYYVPAFSGSIFVNTRINIPDDDLELSNYINSQLASYASRGSIANFNIGRGSDVVQDTWTLTGGYHLLNDSISVDVNVKQSKKILYSFVVKGKRDRLKELAAEIVHNATALIVENKH